MADTYFSTIGIANGAIPRMQDPSVNFMIGSAALQIVMIFWITFSTVEGQFAKYL